MKGMHIFVLLWLPTGIWSLQAKADCVLFLDTDQLPEKGSSASETPLSICGSEDQREGEACVWRYGCPHASFKNRQLLTGPGGRQIKSAPACYKALVDAWAACHGVSPLSEGGPPGGPLEEFLAKNITNEAMPSNSVPDAFGAAFYDCSYLQKDGPTEFLAYGLAPVGSPMRGDNIDLSGEEPDNEAHVIFAHYLSLEKTKTEPQLISNSGLINNVLADTKSIYNSLKNDHIWRVPRCSTFFPNNSKYELTPHIEKIQFFLKWYASYYSGAESLWSGLGVLNFDGTYEPQIPTLGRLIGLHWEIRKKQNCADLASSDSARDGYLAEVKLARERLWQTLQKFVEKGRSTLIGEDPGAFMTMFLLKYYPRDFGLFEPALLQDHPTFGSYATYINRFLGLSEGELGSDAWLHGGELSEILRHNTRPSISAAIERVQIGLTPTEWGDIGMEYYNPGASLGVIPYIPFVHGGIAYYIHKHPFWVSLVPLAGSAIGLLDHSLNLYEGKTADGQPINTTSEAGFLALNAAFLAMEAVPAASVITASGKSGITSTLQLSAKSLGSSLTAAGAKEAAKSFIKENYKALRNTIKYFKQPAANKPKKFFQGPDMVPDWNGRMVPDEAIVELAEQFDTFFPTVKKTADHLARGELDEFSKAPVYVLAHGGPDGMEIGIDVAVYADDAVGFLEILQREVGWRKGNDIVLISCATGAHAQGGITPAFQKALAEASGSRVFAPKGTIFPDSGLLSLLRIRKEVYSAAMEETAELTASQTHRRVLVNKSVIHHETEAAGEWFMKMQSKDYLERLPVRDPIADIKNGIAPDTRVWNIAGPAWNTPPPPVNHMTRVQMAMFPPVCKVIGQDVCLSEEDLED